MAAFDASKHITKVSGRDYLEVKWRLVWLRTEFPGAQLSTELVEHKQGQYAVVKAMIRTFREDPVGNEMAQATGYGMEERDDFNDYLEKAETKAIGRALAALGFGTQFCDDLTFDPTGRKVVDAPLQSQDRQPQGDQARPTPERPPANPPAPRAQAGGNGFKPASDKQWNFIRSLANERNLDVDGGELVIWAGEHVTHGEHQNGNTYTVTIPGRYEHWSSGVAAAVIGTLKNTTASEVNVWRNGEADNAPPPFLPNDDYSDVDFGGPDE